MDSRTNLALPDTLNPNTPPELITRKTTVEIPKNIEFLHAKDEISPRQEYRYAITTDPKTSQINILEHFPLYFDCQNGHYEVDLLRKNTLQPKPYSSWIKNITKQKLSKQKLHRKNIFPLKEKENLPDNMNLPRPPDLN